MKRHFAILLGCFVLSVLPSSAARRGHSATADQSLIDAIKRNDVRAVQTLLAHGANPNAHQRRTWKFIPRNQRYTDFQTSQRQTDRKPPSALLVALGLWATDDPNFKPTNRSDGAANPAIIKALVEAGANVNERDPDTQDTPLMAAVRAEDAATVDLLIRHKADVNATSYFGGSALVIAVVFSDRDRTETINLLLAHGAKPNVILSDGSRPLTMVRRPEYVPLLVRHGADINARDKQGRTILARVKKEQALFLSASDEVVKALVDAGAKE